MKNKESELTVVDNVINTFIEHLDIHINEMITLIDSAYEVIMLYKPQTPAQKQWKEHWLAKARKYGAKLDEAKS